MKEPIGIIALLIAIGSIAFFVYQDSKAGSIAVVQMETLVYDYDGMKNASEEYEVKLESWRDKVDTLETRLKDLLTEIRIDSINGDQVKLVQDQRKFMVLQNSYYEYQQGLQEKAKQDDEEMTLGILNQLKDIMKLYAEENNIEVIISNTQVKNIGYVNDQVDITDQLLEYANNYYAGKE